jgi:hypothetical protein
MDFSPEDKYFMLFLLTNEYTTQLGVYYLPIKKAAFDLGYYEDAVRVLLDRFENKYGIIRYSDTTGEVAIKNYLNYSVISGGKPVYDLLVKESDAVKDISLLYYVYENLSSKDIKNDTVKNFIPYIYNYINNKGFNNDIYNHNDESWYESSTNRGTNRQRIVNESSDTPQQPKIWDFDKHTNVENFKHLIESGCEYSDRIKLDYGLADSIKDWMDYKDAKKPRNTNHYANEKSILSLMKKIIKNCDVYGVPAVIETIEESMGNNYQGIVWDKLSKGKATETKGINWDLV